MYLKICPRRDREEKNVERDWTLSEKREKKRRIEGGGRFPVSLLCRIKELAGDRSVNQVAYVRRAGRGKKKGIGRAPRPAPSEGRTHFSLVRRKGKSFCGPRFAGERRKKRKIKRTWSMTDCEGPEAKETTSYFCGERGKRRKEKEGPFCNFEHVRRRGGEGGQVESSLENLRKK